MPDQLEKKLENFEWKNRSCSRHRTELKAVLLQAASKEKSKSSWLQRGWVNFIYMSLPKKVLSGGLVVIVALVIGIVGSGKLPVIAESLRSRMGMNFAQLPTSEKKQVTDNYWQQLQKYVALSKNASDLKSIGDEKVTIVPFDAQGNSSGKEEEVTLAMSQFTLPNDENSSPHYTSIAKIGYDKQGVAQYFTVRAVENQKDLPFTEQAWYKDKLQTYLTYTNKASDLEVLVFSRVVEHYPTPETMKSLTNPSLDEMGDLQYIPPEVASSSLRRTEYFFKDAQGKEESIPSGDLFSTTTRDDIPGGKMLRFTLPNGLREMLLVGKSGTPYFEMEIKATIFEKALNKVNEALFKKSIDFSTCFNSVDQSDPEHIIAIYMPAKLLPKNANELYQDPDFLNGNPAADPTSQFKPTQLPDNAKNVLVDAYGLPQNIIDQLKKDVPDVLIIKVDPNKK